MAAGVTGFSMNASSGLELVRRPKELVAASGQVEHLEAGLHRPQLAAASTRPLILGMCRSVNNKSIGWPRVP